MGIGMLGLLGLIFSVGGLAFAVYDHWPASYNELMHKDFWLAVSGWLAALFYCAYSCYLKYCIEKKNMTINSLNNQGLEIERKLASKQEELHRSNGTIDYLHSCLKKELKTESPKPRTPSGE
ncbi:hypothetical protein [Hydrogenovibrio sp. JE_KL2]|uniref:hypothetical protein n=1 Tax=Hydrogenovibrio sp. JE_KL2 TaxID=2651188 RepID=UPI00128C3483|nr:hypothetical protein [Hydrogenovibrio sp. JE_KL2]MPQ76819.1 hypothetical protein [Hydrogenovibrio sp. JE_KL2]